MKKHKIKEVIEINLKKDDDIYEELEKIQKKHKIKSASYNGIGAGKNIEVGFLSNIDPIKYKNIKCDGWYEITSFIGNIKDGKFHTHITLGNNIANVIGGHFIKGEVAFLFQIYINVFEYLK